MLVSKLFVAAMGLLISAGAFAAPATQELTLKVGDPAPTLSVGKWIKGEPVAKLTPGQIYVVEFWATWCAPCRVSIPKLTKLQRQYPQVVVIGVDCKEDDPSLAEPFVAKMGAAMDYHIAQDEMSEDTGKMEEAWLNAASQELLPTAFVVGKDGKVQWIGRPGQLEEVLPPVVAGTWDLAKEARIYPERIKLKNQLRATMRKGTNEQILQAIDDAVAVDPEFFLNDYGTVKLQMLVRAGRPGEALAFAPKLEEMFKDDPAALSSIADQMVSPKAKELTRPVVAYAAKVADHANEMAGGNDPSILATVARVTYLQGSEAKAIEIQKRAIGLTNDGKTKKKYEDALKTYEAGPSTQPVK